MIKKIHNFKFVIRNCQKGMTYVELIVVLSIFAVMSSIVLFNYSKFQTKVDIKNLANDIALKIVQAQKEAMSGKLPEQTPNVDPIASWKPSYGVYFNIGSDNKSFIYFTDLNNNTLYEDPGCTGECIDRINITKGNEISKLGIFYQDGTSLVLNDMTLSFTRPNSSVAFYSQSLTSESSNTVSYYQISVTSSDGSVNGYIKIYPSGRIQVN